VGKGGGEEGAAGRSQQGWRQKAKSWASGYREIMNSATQMLSLCGVVG